MPQKCQQLKGFMQLTEQTLARQPVVHTRHQSCVLGQSVSQSAPPSLAPVSQSPCHPFLPPPTPFFLGQAVHQSVPLSALPRTCFSAWVSQSPCQPLPRSFLLLGSVSQSAPRQPLLLSVSLPVSPSPVPFFFFLPPPPPPPAVAVEVSVTCLLSARVW